MMNAKGLQMVNRSREKSIRREIFLIENLE